MQLQKDWHPDAQHLCALARFHSLVTRNLLKESQSYKVLLCNHRKLVLSVCVQKEQLMLKVALEFCLFSCFVKHYTSVRLSLGLST